jgi:LemA protein
MYLVTILVIVGLLVIIFAWVGAYNSLVKLKNWVEESWAQIDVQLKRRYDLIPNLVNTVKGYAKHERETLESVIQARNSLVNNNGGSREDIMEQNDAMTGALKSIFALSESYPELKANDNFARLQEELTGTENKIAYARQLYNTTVMKYNTKIQTVPTNIVANVHKFTKINMLESTTQERQNVTVSFE